MELLNKPIGLNEEHALFGNGICGNNVVCPKPSPTGSGCM